MGWIRKVVVAARPSQRRRPSWCRSVRAFPCCSCSAPTRRASSRCAPPSCGSRPCRRRAWRPARARPRSRMRHVASVLAPPTSSPAPPAATSRACLPAKGAALLALGITHEAAGGAAEAAAGCGGGRGGARRWRARRRRRRRRLRQRRRTAAARGRLHLLRLRHGGLALARVVRKRRPGLSRT